MEKMKNKELFNLHNGLQMCGDLKGIKFTFAIAKNLRNISKEVEPLLETLKNLQEEHSEKDEKGNPIIIGNTYKIVDQKKFNEEHAKLMDIEVKVDLHKIKRGDLPADISAGQLSMIFSIISE